MVLDGLLWDRPAGRVDLRYNVEVLYLYLVTYLYYIWYFAYCLITLGTIPWQLKYWQAKLTPKEISHSISSSLDKTQVSAPQSELKVQPP